MGCGCKDKTDPHADIRAMRDRWLRAEVERIVMQEHAIRFEKGEVVVYVVLKAASPIEAVELAVNELADVDSFVLVGAEDSRTG